jgi:hypothetical protein
MAQPDADLMTVLLRRPEPRFGLAVGFFFVGELSGVVWVGLTEDGFLFGAGDDGFAHEEVRP